MKSLYEGFVLTPSHENTECNTILLTFIRRQNVDYQEVTHRIPLYASPIARDDSFL
jgi:hypothetical protein